MIIFKLIEVYLMPILCVIFCLNLVSILKKIKHEEKTTVNTFWLTISFTLILWSIVMIPEAFANQAKGDMELEGMSAHFIEPLIVLTGQDSDISNLWYNI